MTNWDRKDADLLAEAIGRHIAAFPDMVEANRVLGRLRLEVDQASHTVSTTPAELNRFRSQVCAVCRGGRLYACDVDEGWSSRCALILSNATQFGDLR